MTRTAFLSIAAAEMNLGDIFIRRAITRLIAESGHEAVIYTGSMGRSYVEAFELPGSWVVTDSPRRFLPLLLRACLRRRALVVMAPAPASLDVSPVGLVKKLGVAGLLTLARLSGNRVAVMGRALRGRGRIALAAERAIARASSVCLVRDPITADLIGEAAQFRPDIGFASTAVRTATQPAEDPDRATIALSFRFDHRPDTEAVRKFVAQAQTQGFDCVLVTQVRQDRDLHEVLAEECGIPHVDWPAQRGHLEQESAVIEAYSRSRAVVSNRLHALVIGGRCGAVPVIADRAADTKLHPTLDDVLSPQSVWLHGGGQPASDNAIDVSEAELARTRDTFAHASALLAPALSDLVALFGSRRG